MMTLQPSNLGASNGAPLPDFDRSAFPPPTSSVALAEHAPVGEGRLILWHSGRTTGKSGQGGQMGRGMACHSCEAAAEHMDGIRARGLVAG
jgi:hypothetical protein